MNTVPNDMMYELLMKCLLGEASPGEQQLVQEWKEKDPANQKAAADTELIWRESLKRKRQVHKDEDAAWSRFREKLHSPGRMAPVRNIAPPAPKNYYKVAAVWILLAGIAAFSLYRFLFAGYEKLEATGMAVNAVLPDESVVTLNKHSTVNYESTPLSSERKVKLKGEAFFSVQKSIKPFRVYVNDATITVLGTSFYINGNNNQTEVQVETGLVQVIRKTDTVLLRPGEKVIFDEHGAPVKTHAKGQLYRAFVSGEIVCDNTPLKELTAVLQQQFGVIIEIESPELAETPISTTFEHMKLEEIMDIVHKTLGVTIEKQGEKYMLR